jgi:fido (protein-threonine AMPylation protein)
MIFCFFESAAVIKRAKELELRPMAVHWAKTLLDIHRYLFQDVYNWAGQKRTNDPRPRPAYPRRLAGSVGFVSRRTKPHFRQIRFCELQYVLSILYCLLHIMFR